MPMSKSYSESVHSASLSGDCFPNNTKSYSIGLSQYAREYEKKCMGYHENIENRHSCTEGVSSDSQKKSKLQNREKNDMSICLTLKCEERIVMAADSRSTRNGGSYIDGLRKCVWLEEEKLAFAFAGVNILDGIEITDFIRRKRNVFKRHDPVQAINDLNDLFYERIPEGERINVCCASFIDTPEAVYADFSNKTIVSPSIVTRLWNNGGDVIDKLFTDADRGLICPFISSYSELEAVRFLSYIIDTEEGYLEFLGKPNTVGGPRQFLILERGGICTERWIDKNKIW